ncbi:SRPBCC family protein [Mycobacterium sp.]|uniref:SRPBCC family protein n=1 Tax=Mycobacterium sp. TaxID=1785 RepID=UPI002C6DBEB5|nr:SRPBCC family protein [Mycobacterium sp.]HTQ17501.1 SRPBCC family protein [Mycobacterium sp.]
MARSIVVAQSRAIPVTVEEAFAKTLPIPLTVICSHWYGPFPPIKQVRDQTGDWDAAGQTRVITMVGGGSVDEELTSVDPPGSFAYTLSGVKGPMAALVSSVDGKWSFAPAGTGTLVTWQWTIHAKSGLVAPLLPAFGAMWKGYARGTLQNLSDQLVG